MNVDRINKVGPNQISLGVKQFDEAESKQMGLSVNQLGGIGTKQLSLESELAAETEERGDEQTCCMSGAGRVSDISDNRINCMHDCIHDCMYSCWNH